MNELEDWNRGIVIFPKTKHSFIHPPFSLAFLKLLMKPISWQFLSKINLVEIHIWDFLVQTQLHTHDDHAIIVTPNQKHQILFGRSDKFWKRNVGFISVLNTIEFTRHRIACIILQFSLWIPQKLNCTEKKFRAMSDFKTK